MTRARSLLQYLVDVQLRAVGGRGPPLPRRPGPHHTFATRLAEDGATAREIVALLGHASLTTSQAYIDTTIIEQCRSAATRTYHALDHLPH